MAQVHPVLPQGTSMSYFIIHYDPCATHSILKAESNHVVGLRITNQGQIMVHCFRLLNATPTHVRLSPLDTTLIHWTSLEPKSFSHHTLILN